MEKGLLIILMIVVLTNPRFGFGDETSESSKTVQDIVRYRDPFKMPNLEKRLKAIREKSEIEFIPLEEFRMVGVMTGPREMQAMLEGPKRKIYYVKEKDRIGVQNGVVTSITSDRIRVLETVPNVIGEKEQVVSELRIENSDGVQRVSDGELKGNQNLDAVLEEALAPKKDEKEENGFIEQLTATIKEKLQETIDSKENLSSTEGLGQKEKSSNGEAKSGRTKLGIGGEKQE